MEDKKIKFSFHKNDQESKEDEKINQESTDLNESSESNNTAKDSTQTNTESKDEEKKTNFNETHPHNPSLRQQISKEQKSTAIKSILVLAIIVIGIIFVFMIPSADENPDPYKLENSTTYNNTNGTTGNQFIDHRNGTVNLVFDDDFEPYQLIHIVQMGCTECLETKNELLKYKDNNPNLFNYKLLIEGNNTEIGLYNCLVLNNRSKEFFTTKINESEFEKCLDDLGTGIYIDQNNKEIDNFVIKKNNTIFINKQLVDDYKTFFESEMENLNVTEIKVDEYKEILTRITVDQLKSQGKYVDPELLKDIEPTIDVMVITSQNCVWCNHHTPLNILRKITPNLNIELMDRSNEAAIALTNEYDIWALPAILINPKIQTVANYKFLEPSVTEYDKFIRINPQSYVNGYVNRKVTRSYDYPYGNAEASTQVYSWFNFECEPCKQFFEETQLNLDPSYLEKVEFIDRYALLPEFKTSNMMMLGLECFAKQQPHLLFKKEAYNHIEELKNISKKYDNQTLADQATLTLIKQIIANQDIDITTFDECVTSEIEEDTPQQVFEYHRKLGIAVVPTNVFNQNILEGKLELENYKQLLNDFIAGKEFFNRKVAFE